MGRSGKVGFFDLGFFFSLLFALFLNFFFFPFSMKPLKTLRGDGITPSHFIQVTFCNGITLHAWAEA
ncbi:hypothetical protein LZ32DRAFT_315955 [Colletotrichum eremochloae]|nr:hypothetical protein LZ32DRAFT_315955 [Colletotrichum eremochloae]